MALISLGDSMKTIQTKLNTYKEISFARNGVFNITKQLVIPADRVIDLNGATLRRKASIQSIFINKVGSTNTGYNASGNITIMNGTFEGMGGYSYDNLLTFFHSHDVLIKNCTFKDILCHGVELNSSKNCKVFNCNFFGYNLKSKDNAYKECIQIDHAGYSGLVISGSTRSSKCYDGTCCENIQIDGCKFSKSNYRDYPYACIGEHSQLRDTRKHVNISISNCEFECKLNPELKQACLSFTSMNNVKVYKNKFNCSLVARIYSKDTSYTLNGTKVAAKSGDGICDNIEISNNTISGCTKSKTIKQFNLSGKTDHTNIVVKNNKYL